MECYELVIYSKNTLELELKLTEKLHVTLFVLKGCNTKENIIGKCLAKG